MHLPRQRRLSLGYGMCILVGEAPGKAGDGANPLAGPIADFVCERGGISKRIFEIVFDRANLLDYWPGPAAAGKGSCWPYEEGVVAMQQLVHDHFSACHVVFLGKRVAKCWSPAPGDYFDMHKVFVSDEAKTRIEDMWTWNVAPHPSGINRWRNDEGNAKRERWFWQELCSRLKQSLEDKSVELN